MPRKTQIALLLAIINIVVWSTLFYKLAIPPKPEIDSSDFLDSGKTTGNALIELESFNPSTLEADFSATAVDFKLSKESKSDKVSVEILQMSHLLTQSEFLFQLMPDWYGGIYKMDMDFFSFPVEKMRETPSKGISPDNTYSVVIKPRGWYPFEIYEVAISVDYFYILEYGENGSYTASGNPLKIYFLDRLTDYKVTTSPINNSLVVQIKEPFIKRALFISVLLLIIFFTFSIVLMVDSATIVGTSTALLLGMWGVKDLLAPSEVPFQVRNGSEIILLTNYIMLGVTLIFWLVIKWLSNRGLNRVRDRVLPQRPTQLLERIRRRNRNM